MRFLRSSILDAIKSDFGGFRRAKVSVQLVPELGALSDHLFDEIVVNLRLNASQNNSILEYGNSDVTDEAVLAGAMPLVVVVGKVRTAYNNDTSTTGQLAKSKKKGVNALQSEVRTREMAEPVVKEWPGLRNGPIFPRRVRKWSDLSSPSPYHQVTEV